MPLVPLTLTGGLWVRRELIFMQQPVINALNRAAVPDYDEKHFLLKQRCSNHITC